MKANHVGWLVWTLVGLVCAFVLGLTLGRGGGWEPVVVTTFQTEYRVLPAAESGGAVEEPASLPVPTEAAPLELNTATQAQLELLPGIGTVLADAILTYRAEFGPFVTKEQLMEVPGIGEKRYAAVENLIFVEETP